MHKNQTSKWLLDALLFAGFLLAFLLDLTGLGLHQWLGLGVAGFAAYHLITRWDWVKAVTRRFFDRTSSRSRLYWVFDGLIFGGLTLISLTGLVISTWLNLNLANYASWLHIHIQASILTLILVVMKIAMHWRWVVIIARKVFSGPAGNPRQVSPVSQPALSSVPVVGPARQPVSRRDFLKMMGIVGATSLIALGSAASALHNNQASLAADSESYTGETSSSLTQSGSLGLLESTSLGSACQVQCGQRCAYPGHCRRYRDTNGNNRCDYGECA